MSETIQAIELREFGAPENMQLITKPVPEPNAGEIRIRLKAVGLNMADTYQRTGLYPLPLPTGLGAEGAGIVEAVGAGVDMAIGTRVASSMAIGAYAEAIVLPASAVVLLPDSVGDEPAAAIMLKGMTVDYLFNDTFVLHGGETVLFHAAAGGVGLIACQWARHLGVRLIGTASTKAKCERAIAHGAAECYLSDDPDLAETLKQASGGQGFPVVYDSVGHSTYRLSLEALAPFGTFASFGNASGPIASIVPAELATHGSLKFTRPTLATYLFTPGWMQASAERIFALMEAGALAPEINQRYRLTEVVQAHRDLESRATTGCSVILP